MRTTSLRPLTLAFLPFTLFAGCGDEKAEVDAGAPAIEKVQIPEAQTEAEPTPDLSETAAPKPWTSEQISRAKERCVESTYWKRILEGKTWAALYCQCAVSELLRQEASIPAEPGSPDFDTKIEEVALKSDCTTEANELASGSNPQTGAASI